MSPSAQPPWLQRLDALLFSVLAAAATLHALWMFVVERHFFSPLTVAPLIFVHFAITWYFFVGARPWLARPRRKWAWFGIVVAFMFVAGLAVVPILLLAPLLYGLFRVANVVIKPERLPARWWGPRHQVAVLVLLFGVVGPLLNHAYLLRGAFFTLGRREPPVMMENPLYDINADTFRGPLVPKERSTRPRLLFIGDSTTWGFPYRFEESYPFLVGAALGAEVVNTAMPSQSMVQIERKLDGYLAWKPDVIVVMVGVQYLRSVEHRRRIEAFERPLLDLRTEWVFLPPFVADMIQVGPYDHFRTLIFGPEDNGDRDANLAVFRDALERFSVRAAASGSRIVFLEYPALTLDPEVRSTLQDAASRHGFEWLPLADVVPKDEYAFNDKIHPTKDGHRRIAEAIVRQLDAVRPAKP